VAARGVSEETRRVLAGRQAALTSLTKHPNWQELVDEVARRRKRIEKTVLTIVFGPAPVDTLELAYWRGVVDGIEWFARVPTKAESSLEKFLKEHASKGVEE
jgi:hypothetical protein